MSLLAHIRRAALAALLALPLSLHAAEYPAPKEGAWTARDFRFHTGEVMPELRLHYTTVGEPSGMPVLVLHGTGGSGTGLLSPTFAGELFGPGQALDATKYYVILPDSIGAGKSGKPSDGLRARFPRYNYDDMVLAQYRLLTEGLGLTHLRLVLGNSMGGMQAWTWGVTYPGFMDALVPMASQPTAMASRNWMLRRLMLETIRQDPAYMGGDYTAQPPSLRLANTFYAIATNGGTLAYQDRAPTTALADKLVDDALALPSPRDANDFIYQWAASAGYDPAPRLGRIEAPVLAINSADDERNPVETGVMAGAMQGLRNGRLHLIPASASTRGHGTTGFARFWTAEVQAFMQMVPQRQAQAAK